MKMDIQEVDRVEILTLQDNYFDALIGDSNAVVQRALPIKDMAIKNTILAEHGFSSVVTVTRGDVSQSLIFDFGFSEFGAAFNAEALDADLTQVDALALSHGHLDHVGGLKKLVEKTGKTNLPLAAHPTAFREERYLKLSDEIKFSFPSPSRAQVTAAGVNLVETKEPCFLLGEQILFLGEIPRRTDFEKGAPNFFYSQDGVEHWDPIEDDTALVMNVRGRGLVILSGCAHSGIINTVNYARELTGRDLIQAVMGGFHLTGPALAPLIEPTVSGLKEINPRYVIPTHCTGRTAAMRIEQEFPEGFLLNMAGTRLIFSA